MLPKGLPKEWLKPHPTLPLPTRETVLAYLERGDAGVGEFTELLRKRAELIRLEREDPLRYGYEPETFKEARRLLAEYNELLLMGQNRSGKTVFASKYAVGELVTKPGQLWAFFEASEKASIDKQQVAIHSMLPPEWRSMDVRSKDVYLSYSRATGFSNFKFILPNGSMGLFFNYKQDPGVLEGYEFDGVWFDELVPMVFIETLAFRLGQGRQMKLLLTFTPVRGYTPVVASYVAGARFLKSRPAELLDPRAVHVKGCPAGQMPYVMEGRRPGSAVLFFHWGSNPYGANKEVRDKLQGSASGIVKIRAYGWADKLATSAFARFSDRAHVITRAEFDEIAKRGGTRYCAADPAPGKNWFVKWYFCTPEGWTIVYREWPDYARYGEWALPPKEGDDGAVRADWRPGPAQRVEAGRGLASYKSLVLEAEGWRYDTEARRWMGDKAERIAARYIDPRMGGAPVPGADEGTSIIELMAEEEQRDAQGRVVPAMEWEPAPGSGVAETVQMIADAMDWEESQPKSVLNCPSWFVVEDCRQSILAYQEFTDTASLKDALKDIVDPDRYFVKTGRGYEPQGSMAVTGGGYW